MTKEKFKELAYLYIFGELDEEERTRFENILLENDEFQKEYDEIKSFCQLVTENKPAEANEAVLTEARYQLMRTLRQQQSPTELFAERGFLHGFLLRNYKFAFSAAVTVIMGVFIGYLMFSSKHTEPQYMAAKEQNYNITIPEKTTQSAEETKPAEETNTGKEDGFDAIKPVNNQVRSNNPVTDRFLAASLISESNPGVRLRTINKISEKSEKYESRPDDKVKQALITALKTDSNPAVRKEALNVLTKYPFDAQIRDAIVYVLSNDKNSGLRVMAIKTLSDLKFKGQKFDDNIKTALSKQASNDQNGFVRLHAASMLKETE